MAQLNRVGLIHAVIQSRLEPRPALIVIEDNAGGPLGYQLTGDGPYLLCYDAQRMVDAASFLDDIEFVAYVMATAAIILLTLANHGGTVPSFAVAFKQIEHVGPGTQRVVRRVMEANGVAVPTDVHDDFDDYLAVNQVSEEEKPAVFAAWMEQRMLLLDDEEKDGQD